MAIQRFSYSQTPQTIAVSSRDRWGLTIFNEGTAGVYVSFDTSGSTGHYTFKLDASGYYEMPTDYYDGAVQAVWAAGGTGTLHVSEWTK